MSFSYRTVTHSARVLANLTGVPDLFIDAPLQRTNRKNAIWYFGSDELWTPLGFPLRVSVTIGPKNSLQVLSAQTKLLEIGIVDLSIYAELWLPTDEKLTVWTEERRAASATAG
jgi:hypothetical protein